MASSGSQQPPALTTWADVDPARFPFDVREMPAVLPTLERRAGRPVSESAAWRWVDAVSDVLARQYGPWAHRWFWAPNLFERAGWVVDRIPAEPEVPAFVADRLVTWRRWLEDLAELFDDLRPQLDPQRSARLSDVVVAWQFAVSRLLRIVDRRTVDGDDWQGWCRWTLQWLLTANGVPEQQAQQLAGKAISGRLASWGYLTETDITSVSEQLARDVLGALGFDEVPRSDNWPDTWPLGWPSWRATNVCLSCVP